MYHISVCNISSFIFDLIYLSLADSHESHLEVSTAILIKFEVDVDAPRAGWDLEFSAGQ